MATVPHVTLRDGVYQYSRRVPLAVQRRVESYAVYFGSRALFRKTLGTKDRAAMHLMAAKVHTDFERRLAAALGRSLPEPIIAKPATRPVRQADLDSIAVEQAGLTYEPFRRASLRAEADPLAREALEHMYSRLEWDGADISQTLTEPGALRPDSWFVTPNEAARLIIADRGYDAPVDSEAYAGIVQAVRHGMSVGYRQICALQDGMARAVIGIDFKDQPTPDSPTISAAVNAHIEHRKLSLKAAAEACLAAAGLIDIAGDKRLAELTRADVQEFARRLAKATVGGKSAGSIARPVSASTIRKRVGFISAAISYAIDAGHYNGANPVAGLKVEAFAAPRNKALMPDKRRLRVDELNKIFQHPWFTGCASSTNTHRSGNVRLNGS